MALRITQSPGFEYIYGARTGQIRDLASRARRGDYALTCEITLTT